MEAKITRVKNEKFEDIKWYIDSIIPYVTNLGDLCFVDYDGTRYMITRGENEFVIVAYENGELNPYKITFDEEGHPTKFSTEEFNYDLSLDFGAGIYGVKKESVLTNMCEQLVYFPSDEELDRTSIDFYQMSQATKEGCVMSYEFPDERLDINYGLNYANYHVPSKVVLLQVRKILKLIDHIDHSIFFKTSEDDVYRKNLITLHNILVPTPIICYNPNVLLEEIEKAGYKIKIPDDLKGMIRGDYPAIKRLEYVAKEYQDFTKGSR